MDRVIEELGVYKRVAKELEANGSSDAVLREYIAQIADDRDSKTIQLNIAVADMNALKQLLSEEKEKSSNLGKWPI